MVRSLWIHPETLRGIARNPMPQPRQRIVFCDCLDCREQPASTPLTSVSSANEAAARQEPPPKCLLICVSSCLVPQHYSSDGANIQSTALEASSLPHLHKAVRDGSLTLLALRNHMQSTGSRTPGSGSALAELEQLIGVHQEHGQGQQGDNNLPTLADRFRGMQAAFSSNSQQACQLAKQAGMTIASIVTGTCDEDDEDAFATSVLSSFTPTPDSADGAHLQLQLPSPPTAARRMLEQLELASAHSGVDMVMVHVDATAAAAPSHQQASQDAARSLCSTNACEVAVQVLQWLDRTLRYLNNSTALQETVLLAVVLTPGSATLAAPLPTSTWLQPGGTVLERAGGDADSKARTVPPVLRPLQSFQVAAGKPVAVDMQRPLLCLRRLPGVVRRDGAARLSLAEWAATGGQQALLAERLLPEIAYKVGRAPKYGA